MFVRGEQNGTVSERRFGENVRIVDFLFWNQCPQFAENVGMNQRKPAQLAKEVPSRGTALAVKYRARANHLTDAERQQHRAHAMSLIHGASPGPAVHARSR